MTPSTIIREAQADGVRLALSPAGTIKATGNSEVVNRWLPRIRDHRTAIIEVLGQAANDQAAQYLPALTSSKETAIRAWLALNQETDPATISEVISRCQRE